MLLSGFDVDGYGTLFDYDDCASFNPRECGTAQQVATTSTCAYDATGDLEYILAQAKRLSTLRGALLVTSGGVDGGVEILTGRSVVSLPSLTVGTVAARAYLQGLRPYPDSAARRLDSALLPRRLARAIAQVSTAYASVHDLRVVARQLRISFSQARRRLIIARALAPFRLRLISCPRARSRSVGKDAQSDG